MFTPTASLELTKIALIPSYLYPKSSYQQFVDVVVILIHQQIVDIVMHTISTNWRAGPEGIALSARRSQGNCSECPHQQIVDH